MRKRNKKGFSLFSQMASINYLVELLHAMEEQQRMFEEMTDQMRQAQANNCVVLRAVLADLVFIIQIIIILSSLIF
jgi:hypothetical protein